jgi:hypothetical protein
MHGRFRDHLYLAGPPVWAQKLLFALLAPIGRLRGYRDDYPEYIRYIRDRPIAPGTAAAAGSAR